VSGTLILLELAGQVGLLLWGTHMVTSGVQRGFGAELRIWLGRNLRRRWRALLVGLGITALLQSSTATGLMATSFTASGLIELGSGLAVMLGANVGTTLITQVLAFDIAPIAPPLILAGVLTFRSSDNDGIKNLGRIAIGLGLMLLALGGLVHALAPIENAPGLKTILDALGDEPVLSVLIAAVLERVLDGGLDLCIVTARTTGAGCGNARGGGSNGQSHPVSRGVLIHQTQDQGIEAVWPGAGREDYDQHKSIKRLR
jgi:phosphate:Na+ symporter